MLTYKFITFFFSDSYINYTFLFLYGYSYAFNWLAYIWFLLYMLAI